MFVYIELKTVKLRQIMREDVKFECTNCAIVAKTAIDILKKQKGSKIGSVVSFVFVSQMSLSDAGACL